MTVELRDLEAGPGAHTLRAAIVETNASVAEPFWRAMGCSSQGEPRSYVHDTLETTVRIWTRPVNVEGAG